MRSLTKDGFASHFFFSTLQLSNHKNIGIDLYTADDSINMSIKTMHCRRIRDGIQGNMSIRNLMKRSCCEEFVLGILFTT